MVKLNGDAIWHRLFEGDFKYSVFDGNNGKNEHELLIDYMDAFNTSNVQTNSNKPAHLSPSMCLNFAWEHDVNFRGKFQGHSKNFEAAGLIASETDILVVIGYSFPIFNREIDSNLFAQMARLEKVYIQDIYPEKIRSTMENAFPIFQKRNIINRNPIHPMLGGVEDIVSVPVVTFQEEKNTNQFVIPYELTW